MYIFVNVRRHSGDLVSCLGSHMLKYVVYLSWTQVRLLAQLPHDFGSPGAFLLPFIFVALCDVHQMGHLLASKLSTLYQDR